MRSFIKSLVAVQSTPSKHRVELSLAEKRSCNRAPSPAANKAQQTNKLIRMPNRNRVFNKLALVLISIMVLELVLIGDQVQPVKAIKKKIYLKKLKKLLPLFALVKPKKKIILLPIPIPIFKSQPSFHQHKTQNHGTMAVPHQANYNPMQAPMPFVMMDNDRPPFSPASMSLPMDASMGPMTMSMSGSNDIEPIFTEPTTTAASSLSNGSAALPESPISMVGPSMTMTIQSKPDGGSNIELSTNINGAESAALLQQPTAANKWPPQSPVNQIRKLKHQRPPQAQQQPLGLDNDHFDDPSERPGGEWYYSSPWANRLPLVNPAKLHRGPKQPDWPPAPQGFRQSGQDQGQPQVQHNAGPLRLQNHAQYRPLHSFTNVQRDPLIRYQQQPQVFDQQQQQLTQALEQEELVPVGPPQAMPFYQAPNGQLQISLPSIRPAHVEQELEPLRAQPSPQSHQSGDEQGDEVQTLGRPEAGSNDYREPPRTQSRPAASGQLQPATSQRPLAPAGKSAFVQPVSGRLVSPAIKGKLQLQHQGTKQKPAVAAGVY